MSECNSTETTNIYSNLSEQTKIRLNEINKIKDYFNSEIPERKIMSKKLSKYIAAFDYIDKLLIATREGVSAISFVSAIGAPVGIASASLSLVFSLTAGTIQKLSNKTRNKKKKLTKIFMLPKSKLNSVESLISQALIDLKISHEELRTIANEIEMKKSMRMMKSNDELNENNKDITKNYENAWNEKNKIFLTSVKCLKLVLKHMLKVVFTT